MSPQPKNDLSNTILGRLSHLDPAEKEQAIRVLTSVVAGDDSDYQALWEADYESRPPTITEFLDSEEYLGKITENLYPVWREELIKIFNPTNYVTEWIIRGAIGIGKTTAAVIALLYKTTLVMHLKNPQRHYSLLEGSPIVVAFFNIFKYLSDDVGFQYFKQALKVSPFFKRIGKPNRNGDIIGLPKNILFAVGSESAHALGQNILIGHLDEANYGKKNTSKSGEAGQVQNLYTETRDRIDSRYLKEGSGRNPGFLIITSSERDESDFLTKHCEKVAQDPQVHVSSYAIWEAKKHLQTGKWFYVFAGDDSRDPKVLDDSEFVDYEETGRVVSVPDSPYFRRRFAYNLQGALRNQAGVGTYGHLKLFQNKAPYYRCMEASVKRDHPFTVKTAELSLTEGPTLIEMFDKPKIMTLVNKSTNRWRPTYFPQALRAAHVDLAKNKDCAGIAMGCLADKKRVEKISANGDKYQTHRLRVWMDFVLRIKAKPGSEIDFEKIRDLFFYLRSVGFKLGIVSYDGWQSTDSIQIFKKAGINAKELSVDRTKKPYHMLKAVIHSECFDMYDYEFFENELFDLDELEKKIDHPPEGSKDSTDGVAGVVANLLVEKNMDESDYLDVDPMAVMSLGGQSIFQAPSQKAQDFKAISNSTLDAFFEDD